MSRRDELDPEVAAALAAIDATVAGAAVDPEHAELAELALLLVADRPQIPAASVRELDQRVARRFAAAPEAQRPRRRARRRWLPSTRGQFAVAGIACAVLVIAVAGGVAAWSPGAGEHTFADTATSASSSAGPAAPAGIPERGSAPAASSSSGSAGTAGSAAATAPTSAAAPTPPANGRKTVQAAQLQLTSAPAHVDDVAQQVFDVVGQQDGIVRKSVISSGSGAGGYSQFLLSIPSANLPQTMTALSELRYATVASRSDATQDVNDQYVNAQRRLSDAQARRTSLLKQLPAAEDQAQIDSLKAQLRDAEATIASAEATLRSLDSRTSYSQVTVSLQSVSPPPAGHSSGGFTIHRALHDAGDVLTVVAGGALIALAVLVPLTIMLAILWWLGGLARRRRREHTLERA